MTAGSAAAALAKLVLHGHGLRRRDQWGPPDATARRWAHPRRVHGNVRELRNALERALILTASQVLEPESFPERIAAQPSTAILGGDFTVEEIEREHVLRVLARAATLEDAARILGIDGSTLWRKRREWGR